MMSIKSWKMVFQMLIQAHICNLKNVIWSFNHQELVSVPGLPINFILILVNTDFLVAFFSIPTLQIVTQVTDILLIFC